MKNTFGWMSLLCLTALASACGGGGGGGDGGGGATPTPTTSPSPTPTPGPVTDDDARRLVLADLGNDVILPTLRQLDTRADALWMASRIIAAASSCERVPASTAFSRSPRARTCSRTVSAAVRDAMSPAACPPIPSQTR